MKSKKENENVKAMQDHYDHLYEILAKENQLQVGKAISQLNQTSQLIIQRQMEMLKKHEQQIEKYEQQAEKYESYIKRLDKRFYSIEAKLKLIENETVSASEKIEQQTDHHVDSINKQMAGAVTYIGNIIRASSESLGSSYRKSCSTISKALADEILKNIKITVTQIEN